MKAFDGIALRDSTTEYLAHVLETQRVTHAYLLCGTASATGEVALHFAAALIADGDADEFSSVLHKVHPDFHAFVPESPVGYLVDQARAIVGDAALSPVRATHKVYLVEKADRLRGAAANALLKTLEEPPADVVFILIAKREENVLETIRSRCEVLRLSDTDSAVCPDAPELFELLSDVAAGADNRRILSAVKTIVAHVDESTGELAEAHAVELETGKDYLNPSAMKELTKRHKREITAAEHAAFLEVIGCVRSWLRDCLLVCNNTPELRIHTAFDVQTLRVGTSVSSAQLLEALSAAAEAESRIVCNVTAQLVLEAMFIEIRRALVGS